MTAPYDYEYKVHRNMFQRAWSDPWTFNLGWIVGLVAAPLVYAVGHAIWHGIFGHPAPIPIQCVNLNGKADINLWLSGHGIVHCYVPKTLPTHGPVST